MCAAGSRRLTARTSAPARSTSIGRSSTRSSSTRSAKTASASGRTPVAGTVKRPEEGDRPVETFEPEEVWAIAAAARSSLHRTRPRYGYSEATNAEWQRINDQDAALYIVAACTGMRLGELCALRWADVDLKGGFIVVSRAMSAGQEMSTKSRRMRPVPIADQAKAELKRLAARESHTARTDFVFCRPDGGSLDRTAVRKRFIKAQEEAGSVCAASTICGTPSAASRSASSTWSRSRT